MAKIKNTFAKRQAPSTNPFDNSSMEPLITSTGIMVNPGEFIPSDGGQTREQILTEEETAKQKAALNAAQATAGQNQQVALQTGRNQLELQNQLYPQQQAYETTQALGSLSTQEAVARQAAADKSATYNSMISSLLPSTANTDAFMLQPTGLPSSSAFPSTNNPTGMINPSLSTAPPRGSTPQAAPVMMTPEQYTQTYGVDPYTASSAYWGTMLSLNSLFPPATVQAPQTPQAIRI